MGCLIQSECVQFFQELRFQPSGSKLLKFLKGHMEIKSLSFFLLLQLLRGAEQQVLSDLYFTLVLSEAAGSFLLKRKCSAVFSLGSWPELGQFLLQCKAYSGVC